MTEKPTLDNVYWDADAGQWEIRMSDEIPVENVFPARIKNGTVFPVENENPVEKPVKFEILSEFMLNFFFASLFTFISMVIVAVALVTMVVGGVFGLAGGMLIVAALMTVWNRYILKKEQDE